MAPSISMITTPFDWKNLDKPYMSQRYRYFPDPPQRDSSCDKVTVPIGQIIYWSAENIWHLGILPT
jgi:hypothetical protein